MDEPFSKPPPDPEIANLCQTCRRVQFNDQSFACQESGTQEQFGEIIDADGFPRLVYPTCISQPKELWTDSLPHLPSLHQSPATGCHFCRFLCAIILSTDVDDAALQAFDQPLRNLPGSRAITISTRYIWNAESTRCGYYAMENDAEAEHPARYRSLFDREKQRSCQANPTPSPCTPRRSPNDVQIYQHLAALVIILEVEGFAAKISLTCLVKAVSGKVTQVGMVYAPPPNPYLVPS